MNNKQREKMKDMIAMGKWNYIFKYGLSWGFLTAILIILFNKFILDYKITSWDISIYFISFGIGGFIYGSILWKYINKKVKQK